MIVEGLRKVIWKAHRYRYFIFTRGTHISWEHVGHLCWFPNVQFFLNSTTTVTITFSYLFVALHWTLYSISSKLFICDDLDDCFDRVLTVKWVKDVFIIDLHYYGSFCTLYSVLCLRCNHFLSFFELKYLILTQISYL